jgi:formate--tetrahydrofolate ligase
MHGGVSDKKELYKENIQALTKGIENLKQHINNIVAFNIPFIVSITQLDISNKNEISALVNFLETNNYQYSLCDTYSNGGVGGEELAKKVAKLCETNNNISFAPVYKRNEKLSIKIEKVCKRCYGAKGVIYSEKAKNKLNELENTNMYICIAKTPASLSDDEKKLTIDEPFDIHVSDLIVANGAGFIIVMTGNIFRMPGLPKIPEANNM